MSAASAISHTDEINARILAISEDRIAGFVRDPMREIARACALPVDVVIERIRAMLQAGTIRRVRAKPISRCPFFLRWPKASTSAR